jgi:CubicO group peptidase (beta-lactamase class C family)
MHLFPVAIAFTGALAAQVPFGQVGQPNRRILNAEVRSDIGKIAETHTTSGYSVGVFRHGAAVEEEYGQWGLRTEAGDDMTENVSLERPILYMFCKTRHLQTIVGIASMSKAFTAASLGLVMDDFAQGRNVTPLPDGLATFTWDTKLRDLLPDDWYLMDQSASEHARVRDILSHMSGVLG